MAVFSFLRVNWDRVGAVVATVAGIVALILGYVGTAHTEYIAKQIPYVISGGLAGIVLLTIGAAMWVSADLRDQWRELSSQGASLRRLEGAWAARATADEPVDARQ